MREFGRVMVFEPDKGRKGEKMYKDKNEKFVGLFRLRIKIRFYSPENRDFFFKS